MIKFKAETYDNPGEYFERTVHVATVGVYTVEIFKFDRRISQLYVARSGTVWHVSISGYALYETARYGDMSLEEIQKEAISFLYRHLKELNKESLEEMEDLMSGMELMEAAMKEIKESTGE
jgi:hypothetical protein